MDSFFLTINIALKRSFDIIASVVFLIILSPIVFLSCLALFFESGWPVFYSHKRVGKDGKEFDFYKIRSMVLNADEILWKKNPTLLKEYRKNGYKLVNDPRTTKVGKILRRFDIDEMPQFLNVLKGEMSIVGPRAYKPNELADQGTKFPATQGHIEEALTVKPGITGLWQISGRNNINFEERIKLDAQYARHWNFFSDLGILLQTPLAILRSHGD